MKRGFFPLDEQLHLGEHSWTPATIREAVALGSEIAWYRRAAKRFVALTKTPMSKSSLVRLVDECGRRVVAHQSLEAEATVKAPERGEEIIWRQLPEPDSEVMAISMDGVLINIRGEGWKEVKVASISAVEVDVGVERDEEKEVRLTRHSYRAGLWDAKTFAKQQWAEGCRRGLEKAKQIVSVNDGAAWIWLIVAMCYTPCREILDWWHLIEKVWDAAHCLFGQADPQAKLWVEQTKTLLWTSRLRSLVHQVRQLCPRGEPLPDKVATLIHYLFSHRRRMDYAACRQAGYPIGSGTVESGCKVVVQERMKQAGMRWSRDGAQAMLALRSVLLSERWEDTWATLFKVPIST